MHGLLACGSSPAHRSAVAKNKSATTNRTGMAASAVSAASTRFDAGRGAFGSGRSADPRVAPHERPLYWIGRRLATVGTGVVGDPDQQAGPAAEEKHDARHAGEHIQQVKHWSPFRVGLD